MCAHIHMRILLLCLAIISFAVSGCRRKHAESPDPQSQAGTPASAPAPSAMVFELNVADPALKDRLLRGFLDGTEAWKWTGRQFAVSLDAPPPLDAPTFLVLDFNAPAELMKEVKDVTVPAPVQGQ